MNIPAAVQDLLKRLEAAGFEGWAVGGCVRDSLLGLTPHDWDLCTSARPEDMREIFRDFHTAETGLKHGTLTVVADHVPYEVTTFRVDGPYTDHRHPDGVAFVSSLEEDLARRDFTVNAMAFAPGRGIRDPFCGRQDLRKKLIRCVGVPEERFEEDALRILRALRFAAVYDFAVEEETDRAVRKLYPTLERVAKERIRTELDKLLCGRAAGRILRAWPEVFAFLIPELGPMIGYDQHNHHHSFDLWEHTVQALENVPPERDLRVTMLLHDTGKPGSRVMDEKGEAHYRGHPVLSGEIARRVTEDLRYDRATQERIVRLVIYHDIPLRNADGTPRTDRKFLLRRLNQFGEEDLRALFRIHRADRIATGYSSREKEDRRLKERMDALDALLLEMPCFTLKDLAVNGRDLTALGLKGKDVGEGLQALLGAVMDGWVRNEREELLKAAESLAEQLRGKSGKDPK